MTVAVDVSGKWIVVVRILGIRGSVTDRGVLFMNMAKRRAASLNSSVTVRNWLPSWAVCERRLPPLGSCPNVL